MNRLLMPKATAVWLVDNTTLTFDQIGKFCNLHGLEVQAIADGDVAGGMVGADPVQAGYLTREEIVRCEADPTADLELLLRTVPAPARRTKGPKYTPVARRAEKPDGVAWLIKTHPVLSDSAIARLIGTTRQTVESIRAKTHPATAEIQPRDPVLLGLCSRADLETALSKIRKKAEKAD